MNSPYDDELVHLDFDLNYVIAPNSQCQLMMRAVVLALASE